MEINNIMNNISYLKSIKKENEKLLNKYKNMLSNLDKIEMSMEKKIKIKNEQLEKIKYSFTESTELYHKICKNLL